MAFLVGLDGALAVTRRFPHIADAIQARPKVARPLPVGRVSLREALTDLQAFLIGVERAGVVTLRLPQAA